MLAAADLGYRKEQANHNPNNNNQQPDVMAANIVRVDGKSNRSQMAIDVSVANTLSAKPNADTQEKVIEARKKYNHTKYYLGRAEGVVIVPLVVTTYGALGSNFRIDQQNQ